MWPTKMFPGFGTSYPRKKKKKTPFLITRDVRLYHDTSQKDRVEKRKKRWIIVDCRLEIIETGLIKITKIHRVAKCHHRRFHHASPSWELFPSRLALRSGLLRSRATSMCFLPRKTSWKREQQSKEKRMYRKGDGRRTRDNAKRENRGRRRVDALIVWYTRRGRGGVRQRERKWSKETCDLGGCSLSPRIVRRCRCFSLFLYLVVPFPNFTLQIPLLTLTKVDAVVIHLANLLQLHYKEYGESLRNLWFLDMFAFLTA